MSTVVITGSTKGIGKGLANEFALLGHKVVISGRRQDDVDATLAELGYPAQQVAGLACDSADKPQVEALWQFACDSFGGVDIWINNAGLARTVWSILDTPDSDIQQMVHTNVVGTINGCKVAASGMKKAASQGLVTESQKIFNMLGGGSDGEYFAGMGIYGTTKRGLDYFTTALSKELQADHILVGKIRPGMIITEGVIREAQADPHNFEKRRRFANLLCDHVETVVPYLTREILALNKTGQKIRWLTPLKMTFRMLSGFVRPAPDKFTRYGL
ncbi:SDR family oxidoreductase [Rheinheimera sp. 1928-s]|uniref:SDR family oxidoreductase n=1 Tax=Rheinheimera sp. 1928-s TaxID=3033803 RepID=UPI0026205272|nr:SDR family oxidoreductase [Rheinheimera sp. 1928-s]MDF3125307.1 SDR family NAD(P)-dependent oxidoreductase [Rheinheimera sp. 1928-s]